MLTVKSPQEYYHCKRRITDRTFKSHETTNQNVYEKHFHIFFHAAENVNSAGKRVGAFYLKTATWEP